MADADPWSLPPEPPSALFSTTTGVVENGDESAPDATDAPGLPGLPAEPPTGPVPLLPAGDDTVSPWPVYPPLADRPAPPTSAAPLATEPAADAPPRPSTRLPRGAAPAILAVAIALAAGGVGGAIGVRTAEHRNATGVSAIGNGNTNANTTPTNNAAGLVIPTTNGLNVKAILAKVEPAVVDIQARSGRGVSEGTGIVVDAAQGLVLTNAHVVAEGGTITVTAPTDKQARSATVLGADADHDVAVLKVDGGSLTAAELGKSTDVQVGDDVVAIGNALGLRGDPSVTRGIVSGLGRTVGQLTGMLQTDAAINPGNSGGPLVNAAGQVIGINTAIAGQAQNIGFAIPIDTARSIMSRLAAGQTTAPAAFLGVSTEDAQDGSPGAVVAEVSAGSPAAAAGLHVGDRIIAIDNASVPGAAELRGIVQAHNPDDTVKVTVERNGQERTFTVKLGKRS
jgi:putative serine protease PepD